MLFAPIFFNANHISRHFSIRFFLRVIFAINIIFLVKIIHMMTKWQFVGLKRGITGLKQACYASTINFLDCQLTLGPDIDTIVVGKDISVSMLLLMNQQSRLCMSTSNQNPVIYIDVCFHISGSNSVNVFLGLGLPWVISTMYHWAKSTTYEIKSDNLTQSVIIFCVCGTLCLIFLIIRRNVSWHILLKNDILLE